MNERLKELRKKLGLTQQEFADRLKIKRGAIANYEIGRNVPIDAVLSLISREFGVNLEWLRTGDGEMFNAAPSSVLDALAREYDLRSRKKKENGQKRGLYLRLEEGYRYSQGRL